MKNLQFAETIMEEHPDSALRILQLIDGTTLKGEEQALYALLLTQAFDKNNIDIANDSLISIATDFYASTNDNRHKMLAEQEQAWVNFYTRDYGTALENALFAYDLSMALDDVQNISRIEFLIAKIYALGNNDTEAYKWDLLSLNHAKQCVGKQEWLINSYECIAQDLLRMMWPKKAIQYADSALALSSEPRPYAEETKCLSYLVLKDTHKADSIISILSSLNY